jgi:uncharacterized protein (DUF1330 family)
MSGHIIGHVPLRDHVQHEAYKNGPNAAMKTAGTAVLRRVTVDGL